MSDWQKRKRDREQRERKNVRRPPGDPTPHGSELPIPRTYEDVPPGYTEDSATFADLRAAGFHAGGEPPERKPGTAPALERFVDGRQTIRPEDASALLAESLFHVLRDPAGKIVATWDEGRWWTPEESDAFTAMIGEGLGAE